jgi:RNA polymerase sigma factor (TIGR02999 family)
MSELSRILAAAQKGDKAAASQLLPLVYDELRQLATHRLANESAPLSMNATGLVHEAYLRLVGTSTEQKQWDGRSHFFGAAAEAMRRILVEAARRRQSQKHGGDVRLEPLPDEDIPLRQPPEEILSISDALERLSEVNAPAAELVKLRYFAGFTQREIAEILNIAPRTADSLWSYARAWLSVEVRSRG